MHTILEPKVEQIVEEIEQIADKVEEVVEKAVEKVEGSDKVGEIVDKGVAKDGDVVTKLEPIFDNFKEIIQIEEAPKVEGKGISL